MAKDSKPDPENELPVPLSASERKEFQAAIKRRAASMIKSMRVELAQDEGTAIQNLRTEANIQFSAGELNDMIAGVDDQITTEIEARIEDRRTSINAQIHEVDNEYAGKLQEMKERHKAEFDALQADRNGKKEKLKNELARASDDIAEQHCAELTDQKKEYMRQLAIAQEQEVAIRNTARQRVALASRYRDRIENVITDAENRILEELLIANDRQTAVRLLSSLPTVDQVISMCSNQEGINRMLGILNPNVKQIPLLENQEDQSPKNDDDDIVVEVPNVAANVRIVDSYEDREDERDHNNIYADTDVHE